MAKTLLIVDDSSSSRTAARLALVRAGFEVVEAVDGQEALARLDALAEVHLIVSDLNMPHLDGIGLLTRLQQHEKHRCVPVIMLSAEARDELKQLGRAAGAKAWIVKPCRPAQLLEVVVRLALP